MSEMLPVAILAGGLATRLRPLTEEIPKSLIEVDGQPFIAYQLQLLRKNHFKRVVLCVGYLGDQIYDFVGDGSRFDLQVSYIFDGDSLKGTGGAIKQALPLLGDAFFILYGDSYLPCDYVDIQHIFEQRKEFALMTIYHNQGLWDVSNVEFHHGKIYAYDKKHKTTQMDYIDYGLGVMRRQAFQLMPGVYPYDLADFYQLLLQHEQLVAYEVKQRFYEAGSFNGLKELEQFLRTSYGVY